MLKNIWNAIIEARQAHANYMIRKYVAEIEYKNEDPHYVANYILGDKR